MPELETFAVRYRDDRGRPRKLTVRADGDRGFRGDFRSFSDVSGGREALKQPGAPWATTDALEAEQLAKRRIAELLAKRQARRDGRPLEDPLLVDYIETYLEWKATLPGRTASLDRGATKIATATLDRDRLCLANLAAFLGEETRLSAVTDAALSAYIRRRRADGRAERTLLHELQAFSGPWNHAKAAKVVQGDSPVPATKKLERVQPPAQEAAWLETGEVVRLLDAARALDADPASRFVPCLYPMLAGYVLTGCRKEELFGLERADVDFDNQVIHVRPNRWRGLKSRHSRREIPLWPQLAAILQVHIAGLRPGWVLLFPSPRHRIEQPYAEIDHALAAAVQRAKIETPTTTHTLRHTFTAHRLNTLDRGAPVSIWTVSSELGHRDLDMISRVYGHVLQQRDRHGVRRDVLEYVTAKVLPLAARQA